MAKKVTGVRANKPNDSFGTVNSDTLYKGNYREEVYKDDDEESSEEEVEAQEADPEESATPQETFAKQKQSSDADYKKRYDDLKRHYDGRLDEWKKEKEEHITRLNTTTKAQPESTDDLASFKDQYPDVYDAIHKISASQSEARVRNLEGELKEIKEREVQLEKQKAYQELLRLQPDFEDIKSSDKFIEWLDSQPTSISDGVYNNSTDSKWASRVIDLYKADSGLVKKSSARSSKKSDAAMSVSKSTAREVSSTKGESRIWKASEIRSLKPWEFEKLEDELDSARREGRIDPNN